MFKIVNKDFNNFKLIYFIFMNNYNLLLKIAKQAISVTAFSIKCMSNCSPLLLETSKHCIIVIYGVRSTSRFDGKNTCTIFFNYLTDGLILFTLAYWAIFDTQAKTDRLYSKQELVEKERNYFE